MKRNNSRYSVKSYEGFSLVEIIITIAIMAILVGVIALAVIPNIGRSHESKDLARLDNIAASVNIAIANNRISENGQFIAGTVPADGTPERTVYDAVQKELGDFSQIKMESAAAQGYDIKIEWSIENNGAARVVVQLGDGNVSCDYTKGIPGNSDGYQYFRISNDG